MTNLKRLGLVTERTEQKYRDRDILFGDKARGAADRELSSTRRRPLSTA
jgi:hypothetical protein